MKTLLVLYTEPFSPTIQELVKHLETTEASVHPAPFNPQWLETGVLESEHLASKEFEGIVLCCPEHQLQYMMEGLSSSFAFPIWWWSKEARFDLNLCYKPTGILTSSMSPAELKWSLALGAANFRKILRSKEQIKKLEDKLEGRKLIDRAKGILAETLGMKEEEAFRYLRSLSMKERKSMAAICTVIINTYGPLLDSSRHIE
ncbi:ANTAR domain-containing response regulator [Paenibacillus septentrionalis]|uniref:ANTAR domain-containing response regulator n=1 Tax=Paenibacillus septentrionalis TaxID=429342 RepID=A0ABW1V772_9BACL